MGQMFKATCRSQYVSEFEFFFLTLEGGKLAMQNREDLYSHNVPEFLVALENTFAQVEPENNTWGSSTNRTGNDKFTVTLEKLDLWG